MGRPLCEGPVIGPPSTSFHCRSLLVIPLCIYRNGMGKYALHCSGQGQGQVVAVVNEVMNIRVP